MQAARRTLYSSSPVRVEENIRIECSEKDVKSTYLPALGCRSPPRIRWSPRAAAAEVPLHTQQKRGTRICIHENEIWRKEDAEYLRNGLRVLLSGRGDSGAMLWTCRMDVIPGSGVLRF